LRTGARPIGQSGPRSSSRRSASRPRLDKGDSRQTPPKSLSVVIGGGRQGSRRQSSARRSRRGRGRRAKPDRGDRGGRRLSWFQANWGVLGRARGEVYSAAPAGRGELFSAGAARRIGRRATSNPRSSRGRDPHPAEGRPRTFSGGRRPAENTINSLLHWPDMCSNLYTTKGRG